MDLRSMEEVHAFLAEIKDNTPPDVYEAFEFMFGVRPNMGDAESVRIGEEDILIDKSIAPLVADLNKRGIRTLACCSGLESEHPADDLYRPTRGYLALAYHDALFSFLERELADADIPLEKGEAYFQPAISVQVIGGTDDAKKQKWALVTEILGQYEADSH